MIEAQFLIAVVNCVLSVIALWILGFPQLLGLALIGVAFMLPVAVPFAPLKFAGFSGFVGANSFIANIGLGLTLMGVNEMYRARNTVDKFHLGFCINRCLLFDFHNIIKLDKR